MCEKTEIMQKNRVMAVITAMGFKPEPTEQKLSELRMTRHRFNKIIENEADLTTTELLALAAWLKVDIKEII